MGRKAEEDFEAMTKKFGNKTVYTVLKEIPTELHVYEYFAELITSGFEVVRSYWRIVMSTIESRLHGRIIGDSNAEIELIYYRYVKLPTMVKLGSRAGVDQRANDICFVLGSSGSGKTFFSVKDAAEYKKEQQTKFNGNKIFDHWVTLRLDDFREYEDVKEAVKMLKQKICDADTENTDIADWQRLKMHLTVVIDEASSFFEVVSNVKRLYNALKHDVPKALG
jgi:Zonular occludens toxin (Zot)